MHEPFEDMSPMRLLAAGDAFLADFAESEEARALLPWFRETQDELRRATAERQLASESAARAFSARDEADQQLDRSVSELSLEALDLGGGDASDPEFARLFPDGPQSLTCIPVEQELKAVASLLERLRSHPLCERWLARLEADRNAVERAQRELDRALREEAAGFERCRRAFFEWRIRARMIRATLERRLRTAGEDALADRLALHLPLRAADEGGTGRS